MPPRKRKPAGPTPVETIRHQAKRVNVPTADAAQVYEFEPEPAQVRYRRDPTLDPQLVWRGKDEQDSVDLIADAPPIYIQEKLEPLALVENLRDTAKPGEDEPEYALFDTFDGLDELDRVEFYRHRANWSNRMILGDSLQVMSSLAERERLRGKVQMIYIDPPYGIKFGSNWQARVDKRDVRDGKMEDAAREAEQIKAFRDTWELGIHSYLAYLRDRLLAARALLTESGSCFVQIGDENVHLVRCLMDEVFGSENFAGQIAFKTTSGKSSATLDSVHDYLLWYSFDITAIKYRELRVPRSARTMDNVYNWVDDEGSARRVRPGEAANGRRFMTSMLHSQSGGDTTSFAFDFDGHQFGRPGMYWKTTRLGMTRLANARRLMRIGNTLMYRRYEDDHPVVGLTGMWDDTVQSTFAAEKYYVVQTSTKVIERCMLMCTDPGDLVLDPTCGSGTTAYVAEQWGRRWITIDTSRVALALARQRVLGARFPYYLLADSAEGRTKEQEITGKPVPPADTHDDITQGFVYERVQHITLKSIANNPDIHEGMSRAEIDTAIKRHADYEVLYDRPYEDNNRVRVSGPFTVESLSPHRSLAFAGAMDPSARETISERTAATDPEGPNFEQSVLDNLAKAGIQNGRRDERIQFETLDSYAGAYIQATGEQAAATEEAPSRVGVAIGPQYGTVSPSFIKSAAKEAIAAGDVDLLCVLGFAFDAQASEVTEVDGVNIQATDQGFASVAQERKLGRLKVLLVRMNVDLLMGEALKKTGAGNLFTVFGEPDIGIQETDGKYVVTIRGVDVYDPTTGRVRSADTKDIALWMIDTNYDGEAFLVRHCYFTGTTDPYKRLKTALRAEIDAEAWASLYRTESRPFDPPKTGRIAVKVINDYGDEVMKVFDA